jgi:TetR/AcrR family transcriptional repressor of nem operon
MNSRADASRQRIIEVAAELMAVQGYERTCLEAILERAGTSKGNFYHHFPSKEDLGLAVLDHIGDETQAFLRGSMQPHPDPLARIEAMLDALLTATTEREGRGGCPLGNLAAEMSDVSEAFRGRLARVFAAWQGLVAETLAEARRRHGCPDVEVEGLAHYIICALEGSLLLAKLMREPGEVGNTVTNLKSYIRQQFTN